MAHLLPAAGRRTPDTDRGPLLVASTSSPMHISESERFGARDAAAAEAQRRAANLSSREERIQDKRAWNTYREQQRLGRMEGTERQKEGVLEQKRQTGTGNLRNKSLQEYDLFTLEYKNTPGGNSLRHTDGLISQQQQERYNMLYTKVNRTTHNIITGEPVPQRAAPAQAPGWR